MKKIKSLLLALAVLGMLTVFGSIAYASSDTYECYGVDIYLALRSAKAFDANNEIGKIYPGQTVEVQSYDSGTYWYVYSPTLNKYGYVNKDYLRFAGTADDSYTVKVSEGYLALRTAKAFDASNEIGKLYTGDKVEVEDKSDSKYWYVYSPKHNKYGYVNKNYLFASESASGTPYSVKVSEGYLALRNAMAFDYNNEIGKLYTGDTVYLQDKTSNQYWYVYSPKHDKYGYVNKDYLTASGSSSSSSTVSGTKKSVSVSKGYLALRSAMAYDYNNEIGKLYTGDTVYVQEKTGDQYWYVYSPKHDKYGYVNKDYLK